MAEKVGVLLDTDIFIDHLNHRLFREFFESDRFVVYYSVVSKKELLSKEGLANAEAQAIRRFLRRYRIIAIDQHILWQYSELRKHYPRVAKEDFSSLQQRLPNDFPL